MDYGQSPVTCATSHHSHVASPATAAIERSIARRRNTDLGESPVTSVRSMTTARKLNTIDTSTSCSTDNKPSVLVTEKYSKVLLSTVQEKPENQFSSENVKTEDMLPSQLVNMVYKNFNMEAESECHQELTVPMETQTVECTSKSVSSNSTAETPKSPSSSALLSKDPTEVSEGSCENSEEGVEFIRRPISSTMCRSGVTDIEDVSSTTLGGKKQQPTKLHPRLRALSKLTDQMSPVGLQPLEGAGFVNSSDVSSGNPVIATSSPILHNKFLRKLRGIDVAESSPILGGGVEGSGAPVNSLSSNTLHRATDSGFAISAIDENMGQILHSTANFKDMSYIAKRELTDINLTQDKENIPYSANDTNTYSMSANRVTDMDIVMDEPVSEQTTIDELNSCRKDGEDKFKEPKIQDRGRKRSISQDISPRAPAKKANLSPQPPDQFIFPPVISKQEVVIQTTTEPMGRDICLTTNSIAYNNTDQCKTGLTTIFDSVDLGKESHHRHVSNILETTPVTNSYSEASVPVIPPSHKLAAVVVAAAAIGTPDQGITTVTKEEPMSPMVVEEQAFCTTPTLIGTQTHTASVAAASDTHASTPVARPKKLVRTSSGIR